MIHWLEQAASRHPGSVAIVDAGGDEVSYARLHERAGNAADALAQQGVRAGDRVALALPAGADFVAALHGCWYAGAAAVPIDLRLGAEEAAARARGAILTVDRPLATRSGERESTGFDPDAIAVVIHTSGTTAASRPVELTFGNFLWSALGSAVALGLDPCERWLCPMPLGHVGGLSIPVRSSIYGTAAVLHGRFETEAVRAALMDSRRPITLVSLVPTMLARLLDAGLCRPPGLRWALLGGAPISPALLQRARAAGVPVAPTYGMTEACSQIATHGHPLTGVEVRTSNEGEVIVRGPIVAPGSVAADGWLHTGDLGMFDRRSGLAITGRLSDTIITGGENVAPAEVEVVLLEHPAVADAAVHGKRHPEWGEAVVATLVLRDGASADPAELQAFCRTRLAAYKVPKAVEFAPHLPRTASGKLLRRSLQ